MHLLVSTRTLRYGRNVGNVLAHDYDTALELLKVGTVNSITLDNCDMWCASPCRAEMVGAVIGSTSVTSCCIYAPTRTELKMLQELQQFDCMYDSQGDFATITRTTSSPVRGILFHGELLEPGCVLHTLPEYFHEYGSTVELLGMTTCRQVKVRDSGGRVSEDPISRFRRTQHPKTATLQEMQRCGIVRPSSAEVDIWAKARAHFCASNTAG